MKLRLMICVAAASTALFAADEVTSSATYAVMNVTNAYTDTVIAVPWVGLDGNPITISNLVNTTTLADGDKLYMYDSAHDTWQEYTRSGTVWTGATTSNSGGTHSADSQTVQRGTGLILKRTSAGGTVLLCGRVGTGSITTTLAANGMTLFANPTATAVDINTKFVGATKGDTIMVPLNNGGSDMYTYNGTEWGTNTYVQTGTINRRGVEVPVYGTGWQKCGSIPAGNGAWYDSKATEEKTVTWE